MRSPQISASLKQKLSALSLSSSSPSTSPDPAKGKRRSVFPSSWRRHGETNSNAAPEIGHERERLQEVMSRLIFQAGVDFE